MLKTWSLNPYLKLKENVIELEDISGRNKLWIDGIIENHQIKFEKNVNWKVYENRNNVCWK